MVTLRPWFIFSILSLGISGFFALIVAISRTPLWFRFLPEDYFHYALIGHVDLSIVLWLTGFIHLLWNKFFSIKKDRISLVLSYAGLCLLTFSVLFKLGSPVVNNYIPVLNHPVFTTGLILFLLAFYYKVIRLAKPSLKYVLASDSILSNLASGIQIGLILSLSLIISPFIVEKTDDIKLFYERLFWIPGHIQQFLYGAVLISLWYYLSAFEREEEKHRSLRFLSVIFPFTSLLLLFSQFLYPDPLIREAKIIVLLSFSIGLGIPIFIHIFYIIKNFRPSSSVTSISLLFSILLYILGAVIAYLGLKEEDLRIPAHYHGAITSLTMALMGISYTLLTELGLEPVRPKRAKTQLTIFGAGMVLFVVGLYIAGKAGAPRKTFGAITEDLTALIGLSIMGFGAIFAVTGGILFITNMIISLRKKA